MSNATIYAATLRLPIAAPDMEQQSQSQTQAVPVHVPVPVLLPVAANQQQQQGLLVITRASDIPYFRHVVKSVAEMYYVNCICVSGTCANIHYVCLTCAKWSTSRST